ncbi:MAG: homoserine dehydrogenase [Oscillospiraceae bacterium]|nr:homoserine dehydrogenase [Oscillospiraceae bacterium]
MVSVAILGCGIVGAGVADLLTQNAAPISARAKEHVSLKYILDIRDLSNTPYAPYAIKDFDTIANDPAVKVVVEAIGGATVSLDFTRRALQAGKHVVTSNKELVAEYGDELLALGKENGVNYLFEASVGGGIPIIRPIDQCLAANRISDICGILNGTTNYMLTNMKDRGLTFETALQEAQDKGYAEADPADDVQGHDACRKICILASLAFGAHVYPEQLNVQGIEAITPQDMQYASENGYAVKLLARAHCTDSGKIYAWVAPHFVPNASPLANVNDVYNGITVTGDAIGHVMFYGRGAGAMPTASAVVADVIDAVKHMEARKFMSWQPAKNRDPLPHDIESQWYIRDGATQTITLKARDWRKLGKFSANAVALRVLDA